MNKIEVKRVASREARELNDSRWVAKIDYGNGSLVNVPLPARTSISEDDATLRRELVLAMEDLAIALFKFGHDMRAGCPSDWAMQLPD